MKKRILSLALCIMMLMTLIPTVAMADVSTIDTVDIYANLPCLNDLARDADCAPYPEITCTEQYWWYDTDGDGIPEAEKCTVFDNPDADYYLHMKLLANESSCFASTSSESGYEFAGALRLNGFPVYGASAAVSEDGRVMIVDISLGKLQTKHDTSGYNILWYESFEGDNAWTADDHDGDGDTWACIEGASCCGNKCAASYSYKNDKGILTPDNWLISPEVKVGSDYVFSFSVKALDPNYASEKIALYISVDGGEFQQHGTDQMVTSDWQVQSIDLSEYAGKTIRIAFVHHNVTDQFAVVVDCVYMLQKASATYPFTDVQIYGKHNPYADAILWAANSGITSGYGDGLFKPDQACTRAQVVTFLWRAAGCPEPNSDDNPFKDVYSDGALEPYYKAILWAAESGITSGYPDGSFRPYEVCTRAQFVTFLWRYEGETVADIDNPFTDVGQSPYYQAILWAYSTGVTTGYGDGCFRPDRMCSRAEVVTFIYNAET